MASAAKKKMTPFPSSFYVANVMEIFERMSWYGFFALSSIYMTSPIEQGGLGFSSIQRGALQGIVPFLLYLFPVITGALADRYGYRRTFLVAFSILTPAYYLLGQFHSFFGFFMAFLLVAVGAATFKPVVVGTIGRVTDDSNRGVGFGIFYSIVNIGGFVGPLFAGALRVLSWNYVFILLACTIAINFIPTIFFYKEPTAESESKEKRSLKKVLTDAQEVLGNGRFALTVVPIIFAMMVASGEWIPAIPTLIGIGAWILLNMAWDFMVKGNPESAPWYAQRSRIGNWPFVLYLLILSGFWASFNQIFITLPEFIRDFVDTGDLVHFIALFGDKAVHFLASVNIDHLSGEITRLVGEYGAVSGATAQEVMMKLVHYKVRVPVEEISTAFAALTSNGQLDPTAVNALAQQWADKYRQVNPEYIVNMDAGSIVIFQILVSWIIQRWKHFPVLVVGTIVAGVGIALNSFAVVGSLNLQYTGALTIMAIVVFAFGEMIASPKSQEYVAKIAPRDKIALFMGYYFVSTALGNLFGGILSGWGYQKIAIDMNNPQLMWIIFGAIGASTAIFLFIFNKLVVPTLEKNSAQNGN